MHIRIKKGKMFSQKFFTFCQIYGNLLKIEVQEIDKCIKYKKLTKVKKPKRNI